MATNEVPRGPISGYVVDNVKRLRADRRWSLAELSERMSQAGRPVLPSGLHRLEQGKRRVDVDDLVALAVALDVSPITLLLPPVHRGDVQVTESVTVAAKIAWAWLRARHPLAVPDDDDGFAEFEFQHRALPLGERSNPLRTPEQVNQMIAELPDMDLDQVSLADALSWLPELREIRKAERKGDDGGEHPEAP